MCDICVLECHGCGVAIEMHIGDFSVAREHVHPFCPREECQQAALAVLQGKRWLHPSRVDGVGERSTSLGEEFIVFSQKLIAYDGKHAGVTAADIKHACATATDRSTLLFLVDWPRGIHVNV